MLTLNPQYITDSQGKKISVVLSMKEFETIMEELEDLEDVRLYDKAKKSKQEYIDAEQAFKEIEESRKKNV